MTGRLSLIILLIGLLSGCTTFRTSYDFDRNIDFSRFRTYAFYKKGLADLALNSLDKKRMINAVKEGMKIKGFKQDDHVDVLVNIIVSSRVGSSQEYGFSGGGYVYDYTQSEYKWTSSTFGPTEGASEGMEGVIIIDFIDPETHNLLWHGQGIGFDLDDYNLREERINASVQKILNLYPPAEYRSYR